ncbi:MAG: LysR family transcriptional regulator [Corynebacterium sp.]|nr:LysR family transcriptional regulator [Corynebacterium sp.]
MEIRQLKSFLAVCREGSFIDAAWVLGISQPALSRQIKELEKELSTELFIRGNRAKGLELTAAGHLLYQRAQDISALVDKTKADFHAGETELSGILSIGAGESAGFDILAKAAAKLRAQHPNITLHLDSDNASHIYEGIDSGALDFGLTIGTDGPTHYNRLDLEHRDSWGVILPLDHPLAQKPSVTSYDLEEYPLIISRQEVELKGGLIGWLHKPIEEFTIAAQYNLIGNVYSLVRARLGIALALDQLPATDNTVRFVPFSPRIELGLSLIWKSHGRLSPVASAFLEILKEG